MAVPLAGIIVLSLGVNVAVRGSHDALANAIDVAIVVLVILLLILTVLITAGSAVRIAEIG